ncbi:non-ribosomal peptide synthetase, partial [Nostoc sp.]
LDYNSDLFDPATINQWLSCLQTWIESIIFEPELRIADLPILSEAERHQLLFEWNNTKTNFPQDKCIHQLFEAQVEQTPDAVAVIFEDEKITYWDLNCRANAVAHYLRSLGVKPDILVGLYFERSLSMAIAILGILKAGGAYVPFDPNYPQEHQAFMFQDSQVSVLLSQEHLVEKLPEHQAQVVCLDRDWEKIARESQENPPSSVTPFNLAYVIYTSGSTGKPKGVAIAHRSVCDHLYWRQTTFGLTPTDKVLQTISISFDPSVWQIFWPLSFGAQLVMARPDGHLDPAYVVQIIVQQQITVITLVPSLLRVFLEEKGVEECNCLKHVTCGGEALPQELIDRFYDLLNVGNILHNLYGPTEATIDATYWTCQRGNHSSIAPIGRPIANTQIYILDADLQPLPIGEPGELYIGGIGLAQGYHNRGELTAEKFIANPWSQEPGDRLYKTGDLARYLKDGNIEILGRIDRQVKIRGFRVELGEIETILSQNPAVKENVVIAHEDVPGNKRLIAYVVGDREQVISISELRRFLEGKLPEYMVPSAFVLLETIPLTPNGKVDRRALPITESIRPEIAVDYVMPRNETEQAIATVWQKALNLEKTGIYDNFFELGGHSLLMVQVHRELQEIFGEELSIVELFKFPTIDSLAQHLTQKPTEQTSSASKQQKLVNLRSTREAAIKQQKQLRQQHRSKNQ